MERLTTFHYLPLKMEKKCGKCFNMMYNHTVTEHQELKVIQGKCYMIKKKSEKIQRAAEMRKGLGETLNYCKETKIAIAELKSIIEVIKKSINRSGKLN